MSYTVKGALRNLRQAIDAMGSAVAICSETAAAAIDNPAGAEAAAYVGAVGGLLPLQSKILLALAHTGQAVQEADRQGLDTQAPTQVMLEAVAACLLAHGVLIGATIGREDNQASTRAKTMTMLDEILERTRGLLAKVDGAVAKVDDLAKLVDGHDSLFDGTEAILDGHRALVQGIAHRLVVLEGRANGRDLRPAAAVDLSTLSPGDRGAGNTFWAPTLQRLQNVEHRVDHLDYLHVGVDAVLERHEATVVELARRDVDIERRLAILEGRATSAHDEAEEARRNDQINALLTKAEATQRGISAACTCSANGNLGAYHAKACPARSLLETHLAVRRGDLTAEERAADQTGISVGADGVFVECSTCGVKRRSGSPCGCSVCPTCASPKPRLHPAVQHGGEVEICKDAFHSRPNDGD